jgi:hypothetical protein
VMTVSWSPEAAATDGSETSIHPPWTNRSRRAFDQIRERPAGPWQRRDVCVCLCVCVCLLGGRCARVLMHPSARLCCSREKSRARARARRRRGPGTANRHLSIQSHRSHPHEYATGGAGSVFGGERAAARRAEGGGRREEMPSTVKVSSQWPRGPRPMLALHPWPEMKCLG